MKASSKVPLMGLGLLLAAVSFAPAPAPAPEQKPAKPSALAEARYQAALKQYEEVWTYYKQSRTDAFFPYYWSRLVLEAQRDLCTTKQERINSLAAHQTRMQKLQDLVLKVRKLGFSRSIDVGATDYYRAEAERLLEKANAE